MSEVADPLLQSLYALKVAVPTFLVVFASVDDSLSKKDGVDEYVPTAGENVVLSILPPAPTVEEQS
jgi:hypothetical protein